jgi:hypothetical protein
MLIYRLETRFGVGIYQSGATAFGSITYGGSRKRHPSPLEDTLFFETLERVAIDSKRTTGNLLEDYVFGFDSPSQLLHWFHNLDDLQQFEERGFIQVSVYEVEQIIRGNSQCAFDSWQHALFSPIEVYTPTEFYRKFAGVS